MLAKGYSLSLDPKAGSVYAVPDATEVEAFRKAIEELPPNEAPDLFGLHPNAELSFRTLQVGAGYCRVRLGVPCLAIDLGTSSISKKVLPVTSP